jgi:hypothetical protein
MVLNTAIAVGFFSQKNAAYAPVLAALGVIVSLLWFFVNLGGKYWQSRWEERAAILERTVAPEAKLFSADPELVRKDVEESLACGKHTGFQKWLDKQVLKKPSVSYQMMVLSFFFFCFWAAIFGIYILVR